jgi:hypothetical protein
MVIAVAGVSFLMIILLLSIIFNASFNVKLTLLLYSLGIL